MLWCTVHNRHVHEGHDQRNLQCKDKVFSFGLMWPPKRRLEPTRRVLGVSVLPTSLDLRPILVSGGFVTFNQGQMESCTANCGCEDKALTTIKMGQNYQTYSRDFLWYQERVMNGTTNQNVGANMVDIGDVLAQSGVCYDTTMPYSQSNYTTAPLPAAYTEAANHKSSANQTAVTPSDFKLALLDCQQQANLGSVRIGVPVGQSFMNANTNGGWVPVPPPNDNHLGGHAMLLVGYNDTLQGPDGNVGYFLALQSWGNVGDMTSGLSTFKFPYAFFTAGWVVALGDTDNYQQPDLSSTSPSPSPPNPYST